jgi:MFS transporter, DHA3 family, macrolide efflux protein
MTSAETAAVTSKGGTLWNRNFLLWWLGAAQSALGSALAGIALSFLVLKQTGSAGAMGVNLALSLLPALLSPLFGTLVDRLPILLPLVMGNVLRAVTQIGVGLAALRGTVPIELLHALALLGGLVAAFYGPATMGVTSRLVPASQLQRASGLMQGSSQMMTLLGLVGGGLLVSRLGSGAALIFDGLTFAVFAGLLLLVRFPARTLQSGQAGFWAEFRGGLRYAAGRPLLWGLTIISLLINASLAPLEMLLPKRMLALGSGAAGYGLFSGLLVTGMVLGSLVLAWLGEKVPTRALSVYGLGGLGLCVLGLAATTTPMQMYLLAFVMGLTEAATNVSIGVIFQTKVAPEFFGRVGSLLNMVSTAGMPLTLLALAPLADRLPISLIFAVAGLMTLLGTLAWGGLLRADRAEPLKAPSVQA